MKRLWQLVAIALCGLYLSFLTNLPINAQSSPPLLVRQAQQHYQMGEYEQSIQLLQRATQIYQNQGDRLQQGRVLSLISLAQQQLGNWSQARQYINDGLNLVASEADNKLKTQILAQIWQAKGHWELSTGQATEALTTWEQAEQFYRAVGDRLGVKGSLIAQAQAMENLGFYRRSCGRVLQAWELNYDCRELDTTELVTIWQQIKNQPQNLQIEGLRAIGNSLLEMGNLAQAELFLTASQELNQKLPDRSSQTELKTLLSLGNLHKAIALKEKEFNNQASFAYQARKSIDNYQKIADLPVSSPILPTYKLQAQLNQLTLHIASAEWSQAQQLANQIDLAGNSQPVNRKSIYAAINFARSLTKLKQQQVPLNYSWLDIAAIYLKAIEQAQQIGDRRSESYATGYLGQLQLEQQLQLEVTTQQRIEQALTLAQVISAPELAYRWQWQLGRVYRQQGNIARAIVAYKTSVATLEELRSDLVPLQREIQFSFREQVEPVYRELAGLILNGDSLSPADLAVARDVIEALQLAELDNYFQDACLTYQARSINEIDPKAVVIYTIVLPDRLEVILSLGSNNFYRHSQKIAQTELEDKILQLRQYLVEPDRSEDIQKLSSQVYDWLIRPFAADLSQANSQTLVFVLDNVLQNIPMSTLYDGEQYLLEKYAIALTPGLRLLNPNTYEQQSTVLGGGVSEPIQVANQKFTALKNVATELKTIKAIPKSHVLMNAQFTEQNLTEQLNTTDAGIVHLATHGKFSSNSNNTFLLLWQKLLTIKDFSSLLLNRQRAISNPIKLLVLSACETATGDRRASLGLAGIAVRTGAISTLATLWQVNDDSTAALMDNFYQQLAQNNQLNKAEALRQAQLNLWQNRQQDWQVPFFWSGYILIGNWK